MSNSSISKEELEQKDVASLLKLVSDSKRIHKARSISLSEIKIIFQSDEGYMYEIKGSKETYFLRIDCKNKALVHNCEDFRRRGFQEYQLCKHFIKIFQIIYEKDAKKILIDLLLHSWIFSDSDDYLKKV